MCHRAQHELDDPQGRDSLTRVQVLPVPAATQVVVATVLLMGLCGDLGAVMRCVFLANTLVIYCISSPLTLIE